MSSSRILQKHPIDFLSGLRHYTTVKLVIIGKKSIKKTASDDDGQSKFDYLELRLPLKLIVLTMSCEIEIVNQLLL